MQIRELHSHFEAGGNKQAMVAVERCSKGQFVVLDSIDNLVEPVRVMCRACRQIETRSVLDLLLHTRCSHCSNSL